MMPVIVDYGVGNLRSIAKAFERVRTPVRISSDPHDILHAPKLVLPGVGHFGAAMEALKRTDLCAVLTDAVMERQTPILGICLGMQLFFEGSDEGGVTGLGWMDGHVRPLSPADGLKVPNMGWRSLAVRAQNPLFPAGERDWRGYFVHSYHATGVPDDHIAAVTEYGGTIVAAVRAGSIMGVQFHPEKSHGFGRMILQAFAEI